MIVIEARNQYIKAGLQKAYAAKVPNQTLDVFCVSNTMYRDNSEIGNIPKVQASGIPELRIFCQTMTADARQREAIHFLSSTLGSLLNSLELWSSASNAASEAIGARTAASMHEELQKIQEGVSAVSNLLLCVAYIDRYRTMLPVKNENI